MRNPHDITPDPTSRRHWKALTLAVTIIVITLAATAILHAS